MDGPKKMCLFQIRCILCARGSASDIKSTDKRRQMKTLNYLKKNDNIS